MSAGLQIFLVMRGTGSINLHGAHSRRLIAPLAADVVEHICDLLVVEGEQIRRHAIGARVSCRAGPVPAVQRHLNQVVWLSQHHGWVAGQCGVGVCFAFAVVTVAARAGGAVGFGLLPQTLALQPPQTARVEAIVGLQGAQVAAHEGGARLQITQRQMALKIYPLRLSLQGRGLVQVEFGLSWAPSQYQGFV